MMVMMMMMMMMMMWLFLLLLSLQLLDLLPQGPLGYPRGAKPPWYPRSYWRRSKTSH